MPATPDRRSPKPSPLTAAKTRFPFVFRSDSSLRVSFGDSLSFPPPPPRVSLASFVDPPIISTAKPVLGTFAVKSMFGTALLPKSINLVLRRRNFYPLTTPTGARYCVLQCHIDVVPFGRYYFCFSSNFVPVTHYPGALSILLRQKR